MFCLVIVIFFSSASRILGANFLNVREGVWDKANLIRLGNSLAKNAWEIIT